MKRPFSRWRFLRCVLFHPLLVDQGWVRCAECKPMRKRLAKSAVLPGQLPLPQLSGTPGDPTYPEPIEMQDEQRIGPAVSKL